MEGVFLDFETIFEYLLRLISADYPRDGKIHRGDHRGTKYARRQEKNTQNSKHVYAGPWSPQNTGWLKFVFREQLRSTPGNFFFVF